jgi:hypothetical protein
MLAVPGGNPFAFVRCRVLVLQIRYSYKVATLPMSVNDQSLVVTPVAIGGVTRKLW